MRSWADGRSTSISPLAGFTVKEVGAHKLGAVVNSSFPILAAEELPEMVDEF